MDTSRFAPTAAGHVAIVVQYSRRASTARYAISRRLFLWPWLADEVHEASTHLRTERMEIAVRCRMAYEHAHAYGQFAYADDPATLPKLGTRDLAGFLEHVREETARSKETFVSHFQAKYGDCHPCLPVWEAAEVVLLSWLLTLNAIRNICAHHGRLWNRTLGVKPYIPRAAQYPDWHYPAEIGNAKAFGVLTICGHCLGKVEV